MRKKSGYYDNQIEKSQYLEKFTLWSRIFSTNFSSQATPFQFEEVELNLPNQRVVGMDVARTRMNVVSPQIAKSLEKLLTLYCKNNQILYKQGMNQIMIPFLLFTQCQGISYQKVYWMFDCFFNKYLLNLYFDEDFNSLQFLFRMIRIILEYHDPGLARFLDTHDLSPELYSTPWFMTLFANKLSLKMIYLFWSIYLLQNDQFLIFYFIVGLLIYKKNELLQTRPSDLPQKLTELIFQTPQDLIQVYKLALIIRKSTPKSLIIFCYQNGIFQKWQNFDKIKRVFEHIDKVNLFLVLPLQLVVHIYGFKQKKCPLLDQKCIKKEQDCQFCKFQHSLNLNIVHDTNKQQFLDSIITLSNDIRQMDNIIQFVVIDVRMKKSKILINCEIIDIQQQMETIEQQFTQKYLEWRGKYHFILLFSQFRFDDLSKCNIKEWEFSKKFIQILYSMGFLHLGILEGGFLTLEEEIRLEIQRSKQQQLPNKENYSTLDYFIALPQQQLNYYYTHGILKQMQIPIFPSTIVSLQKLVVDNHSKFFTGKQYTVLVTQHLFIVFVNNQALKEIIVYLGNSKSAIEYLIGSTTYNPKSTIKISSIFLIKYTSKVLVKPEPPHLAIHLLLQKPNIQQTLSTFLTRLKQEDALKYLSSLKQQDYYEIYKRNKGEGQKSKMIFENQDTKELTECADFIKKNFQMLEGKYSTFINKK